MDIQLYSKFVVVFLLYWTVKLLNNSSKHVPEASHMKQNNLIKHTLVCFKADKNVKNVSK